VRNNKELITVTAGSIYSKLYAWRINRQPIFFIIIYHKLQRQNVGTPGGQTAQQKPRFVAGSRRQLICELLRTSSVYNMYEGKLTSNYLTGN